MKIHIYPLDPDQAETECQVSAAWTGDPVADKWLWADLLDEFNRAFSFQHFPAGYAIQAEGRSEGDTPDDPILLAGEPA